MKRLIAGLAVAVSMMFAAPAQAHLVTTEWQDINYVMNAWQSHCGNGTLWVAGSCPSGASRTSPVGVHSRRVYLVWTEYYLGIPTGGRTCWVDARTEHGWYVQTYIGERCSSVS